MLILLVFAFISGLITITAPCIWPLLPIILSSGVTGGKSKPLGTVLGLMVSFFLATLLLSSIIKIIPFDANSLRLFAVVVISILGLSLVVPQISDLLESLLSRFLSKFSPRGNTETSFWSGFVTGLALGIVWAPCAGPILASIATLAATQRVNLQTILVLGSYVLGVGISLFVFSLIGRRFIKNTKRIQQIFGVIMILTAIAIYTHFDQTIQLKLLDLFPEYTDFITRLESNSGVKTQLDELKNTSSLPTLGKAPEFVGITNWLNSPPLTMENLKGKVVLVDFWTYTCINCIRTLPYVTSWYDKYKDQGFVVVGVHTPEFEFEKDTKNVEDAIKRFNIHYPVAQDNNYGTWTNYSNQYWPAHYLIDAKGVIRYTHFGEGKYDETERHIQELLAENGHSASGELTNLPETRFGFLTTPETYLGNARGGATYVHLNQNWQNSDEYIESKGNATLDLDFTAKKVFLVLTPKNKEVIKVYLDDKFVSNIQLDDPKLYQLVDLPTSSSHKLHLEFATEGTKAFAFTFE